MLLGPRARGRQRRLGHLGVDRAPARRPGLPASPAAPTRSSTTSSPSASSACPGSRGHEHRGLRARAVRARRRRRCAARRPDVEVGLFARMPGGHSGLTYRVETSAGALVVKSVPPGQKPIGRHDMLRQARIIDALAPTARARAGRRRRRRERAGLVRDAAGRGRVPGAGARRPRGAAGAGRGPDAARRRDAAGPARRTARQGPGRRGRRCPRATSWTGGPARWRPCPPDLVPDAERLHRGSRTRCRRPSRPPWSTATTGSAT